MTTATLHPLAAEYLAELKHAARRLPRAERRELLSDIEAHLLEATTAEMSDAEVLTVLDRLGEPEAIIEEQWPATVKPPDQRGVQEWAAIILLLVGGFIFGVGWFVGLVLLWSSRRWATRDKLIGTLLIPGGLLGSAVGLFLVASKEMCTSINGVHQRCTGAPSTGTHILQIVVAIVLVVGPFATAVYLARRAR